MTSLFDQTALFDLADRMVEAARHAPAKVDPTTAAADVRAKLEAAMDAIQAGLCEAVIAPGASPSIIGKLLAGKNIGTRLVREIGTSTNG